MSTPPGTPSDPMSPPASILNTPPNIDPTQVNDQMFNDALNDAKRVADQIQTAANNGTYINVQRLDNRLIVRAMKGSQDLYVKRPITINYGNVQASDLPRQASVDLSGAGTEFVMGGTTTVDTDYDVLNTDTTVRVDASLASSGQVNIVLPAMATVGAVKVVKKIDTTSNPVNVSAGGLVIDGYQTLPIKTPMRAVWFQFNGTSWDVLVLQALF